MTDVIVETTQETVVVDNDVVTIITSAEQGPPGATGPQGPMGPAGPSTGVSSFNTRSGDVTLQSSDVISALGYAPQSILVSGVNIKTINGQSILGAGNLIIDQSIPNWFAATNVPSGSVTGPFAFPSSADVNIAVKVSSGIILNSPWNYSSSNWYTGNTSFTPSYSNVSPTDGKIYTYSYSWPGSTAMVGLPTQVYLGPMGDLYLPNITGYFGLSNGIAFVTIPLGPFDLQHWSNAVAASGVSMYIDEANFTVHLKVQPSVWGNTVVSGISTSGPSYYFLESIFIY